MPTRAELKEQLRLMREEAQRKRDAELASQLPKLSPIHIRVTHFTGAVVFISVSGNRADFDPILKSVAPYGRTTADNERQYGIAVADWKVFVEQLSKLENIVTKIAPELKKDLDWHLNAPIWNVRLGAKYLECYYGPKATQDIMWDVPGAEPRTADKKWLVPKTEGWKLYQKLEFIEGVVYDEDAQQFIIGQIEARASLDKIAKMERGEKYFEYDFNGIAMLRPFQEIGAEFIDASSGKCIIADEMGLGKTWQSLAYAIKNDLRVVIICPAFLKSKWAREIRHLSGGARPDVLEGSEPTGYHLIRFLTEPPKYSIINYDIVGRKTEIVKKWVDAQGYKHEESQERYQWVEVINLSKPDLIIVDEGHYIKNIDSNRSKAVRKLTAPRIVFMTGTPVLNRPGELWPMLTMLQPEQFPSSEIFLKQYTYDGKTAKNVEELRTLMRPLMIRRLKKDVVKELPPINRINEYHELSARALKLYRKIEMGVYEAIAEFDASGRHGGEMGITSILAQIQRLKMVCAIDKAEQTADLAKEIYEQTDESSERKVLIFTHFKSVAYAIYQRLMDDGCLSFVSRGANSFITASQDDRDSLVREFQTNPAIKYLVVTEGTAKEGHNITAAGHVIFNDLFWTPAAHDQSEGRSYGRLDNMHSINSYYMITEMEGDGSIEEWIMDLLAGKQQVINEVVEGVEASRDVSVAMALINKMRETMWTRRKA